MAKKKKKVASAEASLPLVLYQMQVWFSTFNWTGFLELNNLNSPTLRRFQPQDKIAKLERPLF